MSSLFRVGQVLKGSIGTYTIVQELKEAVWLAKTQAQKLAVVKAQQGHHGVTNERNVLKTLQHRSPYIRPMIEEIEGPDLPVTIALEYLDTNISEASAEKALNRKELKHVSRRILEALKSLHDDGYVHADLKPDNVYANMEEGDNRFSEVKLGDFGNCSHVTSAAPASGTPCGAPTWVSPEIILQLPWNTAADIWAFGLLFVHMHYGSHFNLCVPQGPEAEKDRKNLPLHVLLRQLYWFGPFPDKTVEIADEEITKTLASLKRNNLPAQRGMFKVIPELELSQKDNEFIRRIMKMDWRDRPSARDLLEDEWWEDESGGVEACRE